LLLSTVPQQSSLQLPANQQRSPSASDQEAVC
jgi:hypothetical protein